MRPKTEHWLAPATGLCGLALCTTYLAKSPFSGHGIPRALCVVAIVLGWWLLCYLPRTTTSADAPSRTRPIIGPRLAKTFGGVVLAIALGLTLSAIAEDVGHYERTGLEVVDQPQTTRLAAEALDRGISPWGEQAIIDSTFFGHAFQVDWDDRCVRRRPDTGIQLNRSEHCVDAVREIERDLGMMGYKYGPFLPVLSWLPVRAWGYAGVAVITSLSVLLLAFAMVFLLRTAGRSTTAALWLTAYFLMLPPVFYANYHQLTDALPTALMLLAVALAMRRQPGRSGFFCTLSAGAKLLPGPLIGPVVLATGRPGRALLGLAAGLAIWLVPMLMYDGPGFVRNIVVFMFRRGADPTSAAYVIGDWWSWLGAAVLVALAVGTALRRIPPRVYLVLSMAVLFATAKVFHDDYTVWWIPFLLMPAREPASSAWLRGRRKGG